ncbi:MAG: exodeoxyribonuclease I [Rudaea sp.]|uniref:exodeoxyribonuclease I n=1 Tax=unclassified Rudaea TaxID=2627037 RepID=UPI0010F8199F|nr:MULTISPECIES: exodeoxyribonuclease I [unclassified Rudaea]MBN8887987.1 exodeoxyribonuclease I [Rudaea sp.]MBR0346823.1 exodeoxyribonuclease I [Rudaea sp.]
MSQTSFFWHDYETTGIDPRRDRVVQFAGQRTSLDLEPIGEPVSIFCKPAADVLPHPAACLVTGISPQHAEREGSIEAEFAARVAEELAEPGTCGVGYNSLRFDDEFTRNLLYRNFYDPYEREWKGGNSRWDLIDLARMYYALRPQGVQWPEKEPGVPSFKLEDLAAANHLSHERAHDALSDVQATIAFARLLRVRQPRLWQFYFDLRRKQRAFELLDYAHRAPVLHVSSRYPAERGCLAMIVPLAAHPTQNNGVIVYDLDVDPAPLLELDADEIADRVFTPRADLPEDVARIPLKTVHANKSPALAPLSALNGVDTARIGLDVERGKAHLERLQGAEGLAEKLRQVFAAPRDDRATVDADLAIYSGFPSDADKRLFREVHRTPPEQLGGRKFAFADPRYAELLFRYRARNWPQTLDAAETERWIDLRRTRLHTQTEATALTFADYFAAIAGLRAAPATQAAHLPLLDQLEAWGRELESR